MKRILISLMLVILVISYSGFAFAEEPNDDTQNPGQGQTENPNEDETQTPNEDETQDPNENENQDQDDETEEPTEDNLNVEINLTANTSISQGVQTVDLTLSVGKIEGDISDLIQCGISANLEYDEEQITNIQATKLDETNVSSITYANKVLLIEMTGIKENTDLIKLTLTLNENIEPGTISFKLSDIAFTKNGEGNQEDNQVTNSALTAFITVTEPQVEDPIETPDDENNQDPVITDPTNNQQNNNNQEDNNNQQKEDTTVAQEDLPKTGIGTIALVVIVFIAVGAIFLAKYKNIEVKPR